MNFLINVKNSIQLPKKEALFRLNRVSMRDTMVYALIFTFILVLLIFSMHLSLIRKLIILECRGNCTLFN